MRVMVLGATGELGRECVAQSLDAGPGASSGVAAEAP